MVAHDADFHAWLATPDAAEHLDVARLGADDASRWREIRTARRRRDWASSRALIAAVPTASPCNRSMSHSHGYAALLLAEPALRVGIDVEAVVPRDFLRLAEIAYSATESRHLATLDPAQLAGRFYEFWTLKEAFAKALGLSLAEALTRCRCVDDAGIVLPSIPPGARGGRRCSHLVLTCASPSPASPTRPGTCEARYTPRNGRRPPYRGGRSCST